VVDGLIEYAPPSLTITRRIALNVGCGMCKKSLAVLSQVTSTSTLRLVIILSIQLAVIHLLSHYIHQAMGIEEFVPAILVIAVIFFTIKWLTGPSTSPTHNRANGIGHTTNPDGSIPGVTASMVCPLFEMGECMRANDRLRLYILLSRMYHWPILCIISQRPGLLKLLQKKS
jgi:hypothetical protein